MERVGRVGAWLVLVTGAAVLVGWYLDVRVLTSVAPGYVSMKPNAALGLMVLALGLLAMKERGGAVPGALAAALGAATLLEYVLGRSSGFDLLAPGIDLGTDSARMAPATATALLVLGAALVARSVGRSGVMRAAAMGGFAVGYLAVLGYLYGVSSLYTVGGYTSMAVHTAVCLCLLSLAVLLQDPDRGLVGLLRDRGSAGQLMRPMAPFLLLGPPALGGVRLWGQHMGWFDTAFGVAILVMSMTVLGGALTWRSAKHLRAADRHRDLARLALLETNRDLERLAGERTADLNLTAQRLSTLVRHVPVGIVELDADGGLLTSNDQWQAWTGLDQEASRGAGWAVAVHPDDVERVRSEWAVHAAAGLPYETTLRFVTGTGRVNWVNARTHPMHEGAVLTGHLGTITDVTVLRAAEERFRGLLEAAPDAMLGVDAAGLICLVNTAAERLFGYSREELLAHPIETLLPGESRATHPEQRSAYFAASRAGQSGTGVALSGCRKDGTQFPAEISLASIEGEGGGVVMAAVRDVSERKAFEAVVARARDLAEAAARSRQEFLANMSHEIRTPMNAVIGMTSLLLDTSMDSLQRDYVETVRASGEHLLAIINDILDYAKIDAGKLVLEELPFDVRDWLHETLDLVTAQAHEKNLELAYDVASDVPPVVVGDPGRIRQVLVNLLSNAVKFTAAGEVVVRLSLERAETGAASLRVVVTDTGVGISPDRIEALFDPFTQADTTTTRTHGGTGLGLAISRELAHGMGGSLSLESTPGAGTTATFAFQIATQDAALLPRSPEAEGLAGRRVLVVDDNLPNRQILGSWATRHQLECVSTEGAAQALQLVERDPEFDFAVLDLMMPGLDGAQLGDLLKARMPRTHLILLSSAGPYAHEIAQRGTFAAVLSKPVRQEKLFDLMATLLRTGRAPEHAGTPVVSAFDLAGRGRPLSILVVEDTPVNQKVAQHLLSRFGYRSDVAASGLEALAALEHHSYDLILMDVQMPDMDGLETTRLIRSRWPDRNVRIVAMTANVAPEDVRHAHEAGMDDFLGKPIAVDKLAALLRDPAHTSTPPTGTSPSPGRPPAPGAALDQQEPTGAKVAQLVELIGADAVSQIADLFLDSLATAILTIAQGCHDHDRELLAYTAHKLKSGAYNLGAQDLGELLTELEVESARADWPQLDELLTRIQAQQVPTHDHLLALGADDPPSCPRLPSRGAALPHRRMR